MLSKSSIESARRCSVKKAKSLIKKSHNQIIQEAKSIDNIADRVFVMSIIARDLKDFEKQTATSLVDEAFSIIENIPNIKDRIERLEEIMDDENEEEIKSKVDELNDLMTEYEDEIESIQDDPDGEFPDDLIEEKVDELADDVRRDPESFLNEHGIDWEQFISRKDFIQGVIDADGFH